MKKQTSAAVSETARAITPAMDQACKSIFILNRLGIRTGLEPYVDFVPRLARFHDDLKNDDLERFAAVPKVREIIHINSYIHSIASEREGEESMLSATIAFTAYTFYYAFNAILYTRQEEDDLASASVAACLDSAKHLAVGIKFLEMSADTIRDAVCKTRQETREQDETHTRKTKNDDWN